jgi:lysophospholipase L1-like esterase
VHVVDIHEFGWKNYPDINVTFAKDKFHPSDEGYNNWTKAFLSKILSK